MPLTPGEDVGTAIRELRQGPTYSRTKKRYGKKKANKQAIAIALANSRRKKHHRKSAKKARK